MPEISRQQKQYLARQKKEKKHYPGCTDTSFCSVYGTLGNIL